MSPSLPSEALRVLSVNCHNEPSRGGVAQWLERRPVTPEVAGSSPVILARNLARVLPASEKDAAVAQLVEHGTENARVAGSSPACGTILLALLLLFCGALARAQAPDLEPYDCVRIVCPERPTLERVVTLDSLGVASLPLGIETVLAGLSLERAREKAARILEDRLGLALPTLRLEHALDSNAPVRFRGALEHAGATRAVPGLLLSEVLARAKPTDLADLDRVQVRTLGVARTVRVRLDWDPALWDVALQPGDKVFVPRYASSVQVFVLGSVRRPGAYDFAANLTARRALELAGGATPGADLALARLTRDGQLLRKVHLEREDAPLKPGDALYVPLRPNLSFVVVTGGVARPGRIVHVLGLSLRQAIAEVGGLAPNVKQGRIVIVRRTEGKATRQSFELSAALAGPDVLLLPGDRVEVPEPPIGPTREAGK
jgi:protein involved in polysaccharide export with SLBB domain